MVNGFLPDGWTWTTVGECGDVVTGRTPSKSDASNYGKFMPLVKPPELLHGSIYSAEDNISQKGTTEARVLPVNSVLVSCIGNLGKTGINRVPVAFNQQINAVIFPENIIPEFGFYYFQSSEFKKLLEGVSSATTVSIVNKSKFESLPFPLAPLPEQERIVAKIEALFTQLEAGAAALKRVQAGVKRYKASVLKAAVSGRLVPQENIDEPAHLLLERILVERRSRWNKKLLAQNKNPVTAKYDEPVLPDLNGLPELPQGWCYASADQITSVITDGEHATPPRTESGVLLLSARNVLNGALSFDDVDYVSEETYSKIIKRLEIVPGDVLLSCSGSVGRSCVVPENSRFALVRSVAILRPVFVLPSFMS